MVLNLTFKDFEECKKELENEDLKNISGGVSLKSLTLKSILGIGATMAAVGTAEMFSSNSLHQKALAFEDNYEIKNHIVTSGANLSGETITEIASRFSVPEECVKIERINGTSTDLNKYIDEYIRNNGIAKEIVPKGSNVKIILSSDATKNTGTIKYVVATKDTIDSIAYRLHQEDTSISVQDHIDFIKAKNPNLDDYKNKDPLLPGSVIYAKNVLPKFDKDQGWGYAESGQNVEETVKYFGYKGKKGKDEFLDLAIIKDPSNNKYFQKLRDSGFIDATNNTFTGGCWIKVPIKIQNNYKIEIKHGEDTQTIEKKYNGTITKAELDKFVKLTKINSKNSAFYNDFDDYINNGLNLGPNQSKIIYIPRAIFKTQKWEDYLAKENDTIYAIWKRRKLDFDKIRPPKQQPALSSVNKYDILTKDQKIRIISDKYREYKPAQQITEKENLIKYVYYTTSSSAPNSITNFPGESIESVAKTLDSVYTRLARKLAHKKYNECSTAARKETVFFA